MDNNKRIRKDINTCVLQVNLAKDCRYKEGTKDDGSDAVLFFTGANNAGYRDRNGDAAVSFLEFSIHGRMASNLAQYLVKGTGVLVRGELRSWTKKREDGSYENNYVVEVRELSFLPRAGSGTQEAAPDAPSPEEGSKEEKPDPVAKDEGSKPTQADEVFLIDDDDPFSL